jgi:hypothetical protein
MKQDSFAWDFTAKTTHIDRQRHVMTASQCLDGLVLDVTGVMKKNCSLPKVREISLKILPTELCKIFQRIVLLELSTNGTIILTVFCMHLMQSCKQFGFAQKLKLQLSVQSPEVLDFNMTCGMYVCGY